MLDRTNLGSTERVAALVRELFAKRSIGRPVGYDDDLGESGLSSLDIVNLMLAVEAEFDIRNSRSRYEAGELPLDRAHRCATREGAGRRLILQ